MKTLHMTLGLPGSGKTTWARKFIDERPAGTVVRVNKDDLRAMMHNSRWKGDKTERQILFARDAIISAGLVNPVVTDVIVDDTGFGPHEKDLRAMAALADAEFVLHDFTNVPVKECIARDLKRANSVGHKVINKMNMRYIAKRYEPPVHDPHLPDAIMVDIDGTLAHMHGRSPYDYSPGAVLSDVVDTVVREIVNSEYARGRLVYLLSGRKAECRADTGQWLKDNDVDYTRLFMRETDDNRADNIVKGELYERHVQGTVNVLYVLDDRDQVVAEWRQRGLKVLQVADGDF